MAKINHDRNDQHAHSPCVGDFWDEMLCAVCVVVEVDHEYVLVCKTKKILEPNYWIWDFTNLETYTRDGFVKWLQYGGNSSVKDRYWADVNPEWHKKLVAEDPDILRCKKTNSVLGFNKWKKEPPCFCNHCTTFAILRAKHGATNPDITPG